VWGHNLFYHFFKFVFGNYFVIVLTRESLFPLVSAYFKPDEEMYRKRFENDYKERTIFQIFS